ncbi:MAG TPA: hypothetical protein V6C97_15825 [Oculatellaceae cyanobacterium]
MIKARDSFEELLAAAAAPAPAGLLCPLPLLRICLSYCCWNNTTEVKGEPAPKLTPAELSEKLLALAKDVLSEAIDKEKGATVNDPVCITLDWIGLLVTYSFWIGMDTTGGVPSACAQVRGGVYC